MKIAFLGLKRIGDAVYTLPSLEALHITFPQAQIHVFTENQVAAIYQGNPHIDQVFSWSKQNFWKSALKQLWSGHYDLAVVNHNAFKYALLPFLARVPQRLGYIKEGRGGLLTHKRPLHQGVVHRLEHSALLLDLLGIESRGILPKIYFAEAEQFHLPEIAQQFSLEKQGYVAMIVGSISPTRRWFVENFARVAQMLWQKYQLPSVILGGPDDVAIANQVVKVYGNAPGLVNLAGKTNLRDTLRFFQQARAVVTNDTGPMHAASAIGVPTVTWFGAANEREIKPPQSTTRVLNAHVPCSPCVKETCNQNLICLHQITPVMVFQALEELMNV